MRLVSSRRQALLELHPDSQACAALASTLPSFVAVLASAVADEGEGMAKDDMNSAELSRRKSDATTLFANKSHGANGAAERVGEPWVPVNDVRPVDQEDEVLDLSDLLLAADSSSSLEAYYVPICGAEPHTRSARVGRVEAPEARHPTSLLPLPLACFLLACLLSTTVCETLNTGYAYREVPAKTKMRLVIYLMRRVQRRMQVTRPRRKRCEACRLGHINPPPIWQTRKC